MRRCRFVGSFSARRAILRLCLSIAACLASAARADLSDYQPTSMYDAKGTSGPRGFASAAPEESVDPFSGNLIISHTDLMLPGKAGLDLLLRRVYNSKIHKNYAAIASNNSDWIIKGKQFVAPSPVGLGWTMHLGRVVGAAAGPNSSLSLPRYYEATDGSQFPFFQTTGTGCESGCLVSKKGHNLYYVSSDHVWRISTPDGLLITFGHVVSGVDAFQPNLFYYATEIRDVHGNAISIQYRNDSAVYAQHFIDSITDSAGRFIQFNYAQAPGGMLQLSSINAAGRTITYHYASNTAWPGQREFLTQVDPPAGHSWQYDYAGLSNGTCGNPNRWCELTRAIYPTGGAIDYTYRDEQFFSHTNPMQVRAMASKTLTDRTTTLGVTTYTYSRGANYSGEEHTVITRPDNSQEVYTYFGVGQSAYDPWGLAWKAGVLLKKQIRASANDQPLQIETYTWAPSPKIADESWGDPWIGYDLGIYAPLLAKYEVKRGTLTWTTTNDSFNSFNLSPRCTTETEAVADGQSGAPHKRYHLHIYQQVYAQQDGLYRFHNLLATDILSDQAFGDACDETKTTQLVRPISDEINLQEYDTIGQRKKSVVNGRVTTFAYDATGQVTSRIHYSGGTSDNPTNGTCESFRDYVSGQPISVGYGAAAPDCSTSSELFTVTRTYFLDGTLQSESNGRGNIRNIVRDTLGRVTQIAQPDGSGEAPTLVTYPNRDGFDGITRTTQGASWREIEVDGFERQTMERNSAGRFVRQEYDALGRVHFQGLPTASATAPDGSTMIYDALARLVSVTRNDGSAIQYTYGDKNGADTMTIATVIGGATKRRVVETQRSYGGPDKGLLTRVQLTGESAPATDMYSYLIGGELTGIDYAGRKRTLEYDLQKKVIHESQPESGDTYYGYDSAGHLRCRSRDVSHCSDANLEDRVAELLTSIDLLGRPTSIQRNNANAHDTFHYVGPNLIDRMTDSVGTHTFDYSTSDRLKKRTSLVNGITYVTENVYDAYGALDHLIYPSGRSIHYVRDGDHRVDSVVDETAGTTYVSHVGYHSNGNVVALSYGNGVSATFTPDAMQRPKFLTAQGTAPVLDLDYTFDKLANLTELTDHLDSTESTTFQYDDLDRLTDAQGTWGNLHYTYNGAGDRLTEEQNGVANTFTYDPTSGRLTSVSGRDNQSFGYDYQGKGNLTTLVDPGAQDYNYDFDVEGRLREVLRYDNGTGKNQQDLATYLYDGQGLRMISSHDGCQGRRVDHYDQGGSRIAQSDDKGIMLTEWVWAAGRQVSELDVRPFSVSATDLDFGSVETGTSASRTFTLINRTPKARVLSELSNSYPFFLDNAPITASADGSTTLSVTLQAFWPGLVESKLAACATDGLAVNVLLHGKITAPKPVFSPPSIDFGDVPYGDTPTIRVNLRNDGDAPLRIKGWKSSLAGLTVSPAGALTIQPGETKNLAIAYDAVNSCDGDFAGTLALDSNTPGGATLSAKGAVLALRLGGGDFFLGRGSAGSMTLPVTNVGHLSINGDFALWGAPGFTVSPSSATLAPGDMVKLQLAYSGNALQWSPFGDHATLTWSLPGCHPTCDAQIHLSGDAQTTSVPTSGNHPRAAIAGNALHIVTNSVKKSDPWWEPSKSTLYYVVGSGGAWSDADPTGGQINIWPGFLAGAADGVAVFGYTHGKDPPLHVNRYSPHGGGMNWGADCATSDRIGPLLLDKGGAWLVGQGLLRIFDAQGACQGAASPLIANVGGASGAAFDPEGRIVAVSGDGATQLDPVVRSKRFEPQGFTSFDGDPQIAVDSNGAWHVIWSAIFYGLDYNPKVKYMWRAPDGIWSDPVVIHPGSGQAQSARLVVDGAGTLHAAWVDGACTVKESGLLRMFYGEKALTETAWHLTDVTAKGPDLYDSLALARTDTHLAAVWSVGGDGGFVTYTGAIEVSGDADGGVADSGNDAGDIDGGNDAGSVDSGSMDAGDAGGDVDGGVDSGTVDGGTDGGDGELDAGGADGGTDGGATSDADAGDTSDAGSAPSTPKSKGCAGCGCSGSGPASLLDLLFGLIVAARLRRFR